MPFPELNLALLFILFLALFVLVGVYPALKRTVASLRKLQHAAGASRQPLTTLLGNAHAELFSRTSPNRPLNDFEIIVLRRLARANGKPLSRKQINASLLFGEETLVKTLRSLNRRGLVQVKLSLRPWPRFALTEAGRQFAIAQGYIVHIATGPRRKRSPAKAREG